MIEALDPRLDSFAGVAFVLGLLVLATIIAVVAIWQLAATKRSKASAAREEAYRKLAEQVTGTQADTAAALADMRPRLAAIEKLLRDVE